MKNILLVTMLFSLTAFGQVHTTTGTGNFFNPLLWDCFCVPANGDTLVINHAMILTASIYYNSGQITVNSSGSLMEDGTDRDVWIDGTGSLINNGTFDCYRMYVSGTSAFVNTSTSVYFDSLWNQASIANSGNMTVYDILNDQAGTFTNSGEFMVDNNFNNQGHYVNDGIITVTNDFSNCNIQTSSAIFTNDGIFCIGQNSVNCLDDTLYGSGFYYIAGTGSNFGHFGGTFFYNTSTGTVTGTGTEAGTVTIGNANCGLSISEEKNGLSIYPNPATSLIYVSESNLPYLITDLSGKVISEGTTSTSGIDVSDFANGVYTIQIQTAQGEISKLKFIKL